MRLKKQTDGTMKCTQRGKNQVSQFVIIVRRHLASVLLLHLIITSSPVACFPFVLYVEARISH